MGAAPDDDASRKRGGLVAIARADWLQGHAMETAKMRRVRRRRESKEGSREVYEKEEM